MRYAITIALALLATPALALEGSAWVADDENPCGSTIDIVEGRFTMTWEEHNTTCVIIDWPMTGEGHLACDDGKIRNFLSHTTGDLAVDGTLYKPRPAGWCE